MSRLDAEKGFVCAFLKYYIGAKFTVTQRQLTLDGMLQVIVIEFNRQQMQQLSRYCHFQ